MNNSSHSRRLGGMMVGLMVCLVLAGVTGWIGYTYWYNDSDSVSLDDLIVREVDRGPFDHVVLEQGEIESSSNIELICEVESRGSGGTQILWVVDEGTRVKKGDKLVELDSSSLELDLKEARLKVLTAKSNVKTAEAVLEQAKIAKQEYLQGVYMNDRKEILREMAIAEQDLRKARLSLRSTERLVGKGLVKELQLEADNFAVVNAVNKLRAEEQKLDVLDNLTREKMLVQYESDIESAETNLTAAQSELEEETVELEEYKEQIENCVMRAPTDGVVVHANRYSRRGGNAEFVVEPGAEVRERQAIIRLPDPSQMQVRCKVNESQVTLIEEGMPARISIEALSGLGLRGRVAKVNRYAEPGGWMSGSVKEYATIVEILDPPDQIRTGMTAAAQIFVEQLPDALQIPIQGLYEHGGEMYTLVQKPLQPGMKVRDRFETRTVKIGATNDSMASISEGLEEGESVILNLRQHLTLLDLPEIEREDNSDLDEIRQRAETNALAGDPAVADPSSQNDTRPGGEGGEGGSSQHGGSGGDGAGGPPANAGGANDSAGPPPKNNQTAAQQQSGKGGSE